MFRRMLILATVLLVALPITAGAQEYPIDDGASLTVSDSTVVPGQTITFEGRGFAPGSEATPTLFSVVLGTFTADGAGTIRGGVRIPSDAELGPATLELRGVAPDGSVLVLTARLTVIGGAPGAAADDGEPDGGLALTGSSIVPWAAVGAALLILGTTAVVAGRARRPA